MQALVFRALVKYLVLSRNTPIQMLELLYLLVQVYHMMQALDNFSLPLHNILIQMLALLFQVEQAYHIIIVLDKYQAL